MKYKERNRTLVSLQNLSCHFQEKTILDGVSLKIFEASTLVIVGPGSSGKSTLLNILASDTPKELTVVQSCPDLQEAPLKVAYWKQHSQKEQGLEKFLDFDGIKAEEMLSKYLPRHPQLSAIMYNITQSSSREDDCWLMNITALLVFLKESTKADLLLLDEPETGLLDHIDLLVDILKEFRQNRAMVIVSHNVELIRSMADRVMYLSYGNTIALKKREDFFASEDPRIQYLIKMGV